jgi:Flp pilus assembly protein TadG
MEEEGQSLVEFALAFTLLLTLVLGVVDFAFVYQAYLRANAAANSGAVYGSEDTTQASDTAGIQDAALAAAPGWTCTSGPTVASSVGTDADDQQYVSVTVQCSVPDLMILHTMLEDVTVSGSAVRQVQP